MKLILILILAAMCASAFADPVLLYETNSKTGNIISLWSHADACETGLAVAVTAPDQRPIVAGCVTRVGKNYFHVVFSDGVQEDYDYANWTAY